VLLVQLSLTIQRTPILRVICWFPSQLAADPRWLWGNNLYWQIRDANSLADPIWRKTNNGCGWTSIRAEVQLESLAMQVRIRLASSREKNCDALARTYTERYTRICRGCASFSVKRSGSNSSGFSRKWGAGECVDADGNHCATWDMITINFVILNGAAPMIQAGGYKRRLSSSTIRRYGRRARSGDAGLRLSSNSWISLCIRSLAHKFCDRRIKSRSGHCVVSCPASKRPLLHSSAVIINMARCFHREPSLRSKQSPVSKIPAAFLDDAHLLPRAGGERRRRRRGPRRVTRVREVPPTATVSRSAGGLSPSVGVVRVLRGRRTTGFPSSSFGAYRPDARGRYHPAQ